MPVCDACYGTCRNNTYGQSEKMLSCYSCGISYHPSCLGYTPEKAQRCYDYRWRCRDCHVCRECDKLVTRPSGEYPGPGFEYFASWLKILVFKPSTGAICDDCDQAIHFSCHDSNRRPKFLKCRACKLDNKKGKNGRSSQTKRTSDNEERARHSSDSGSTGDRDRNGLNDSLRYIDYQIRSPILF